MARVERFEDLIAWQKARELRRDVYRLADRPTLRRDMDFRRQLIRAVVSVMSNIAEGFERGSRAEFAQFLAVAKASCGEVRSLLYVALDEEWLTAEEFKAVSQQTEEVGRVIGGLRTAVVRQRDEPKQPTGNGRLTRP